MTKAVAAALVALTVVLALMRIEGLLDWSWHWVTAPLWASLLVLVIGWLLFIVVMSAEILQREIAFEAGMTATKRIRPPSAPGQRLQESRRLAE